MYSGMAEIYSMNEGAPNAEISPKMLRLAVSVPARVPAPDPKHLNLVSRGKRAFIYVAFPMWVLLTNGKPKRSGTGRHAGTGTVLTFELG